MSAADCIHIADLRVRGIVGIHGWEREKAQDLVLHLTLFRDLEPAAASDAIEDTIHYGALAKSVLAYVEGAKHRLLETLAREVARICLDQGAARVRVRIDKPWAVQHARCASVEIERTRADFEP